MEPKKRVLVVGGGGLIGAAVSAHLENTYFIYKTNRRSNFAARCVQFELNEGNPEDLKRLSPDVVLICAAETNMALCESDPSFTRLINVDATVRLANFFMDQGSFVIFLSTSAVFSGDTPYPTEAALYSPKCEYGRQKAEAEQKMRDHQYSDRALAIVRLSKVVEKNQATVARFLNAIKQNTPFTAFSDVKLSPTSISNVVSALTTLISVEAPGILHLSGQRDITYAELAQRLIKTLGANERLVHSVNSGDTGARIVFSPSFVSLSMAETTARFGIVPENIDVVIEKVFENGF